MARSFLLLPCLLVCLACAARFPVDNLKMGMTTKEVQESAGEPRFNHLGNTWIYPLWAWNWMDFLVDKDVYLHFDEEKLVQWQVTESIPPPRCSTPRTASEIYCR